MNSHIKPNAFSLVEVVLSLGIVVFAGFALIGLLAVGLQNSQDSRERTQAATIAEAICTTRRAAPTNDFTTALSPQPNFPLPRLDNPPVPSSMTAGIYLTRDGATTNSAANGSFGFLYRVTPNTAAHVSSVYICLYWPPEASPANGNTSHFDLSTTFALP